jgi:mannose-6-phosphate isomerase
MAIERAGTRIVPKPWGSTILRPWSDFEAGAEAVGEIWFQRTDSATTDPALLIKLLFTSQPLSIQVHPDEQAARLLGMANGKTEAWYILSAKPGARIALGLKHIVTPRQLRVAIEDGSIVDLVFWRKVVANDVILVPAGTIHALGQGLVVAEIQQRSDATFRMFDFGRRRALHVDEAVASAIAGPASAPFEARRLNEARTVLAVCPQFIVERIDLASQSSWRLSAEQETWILVLEGEVQIGRTHASAGEALLVDHNDCILEAGPGPLRALLAYPGAQPKPSLLTAADVEAAVPLHGMRQ